MKYYKVMANGVFIGVADEYSFRRYQKKHSILLGTTPDKAEYVAIEGAVYRDTWMAPLLTDEILCISAEVVEIGEEEYDTLSEPLLETVPDDFVVAQEDAEDIEDIDYLKKKKIEKLTKECEEMIVSGFEISLEDTNDTVTVALSQDDQLNIALAALVDFSDDAEKTDLINGGRIIACSKHDVSKIVEKMIKVKSMYKKHLDVLIEKVNSAGSVSEVLDVKI